jgi:nucleoside-diphosphate-sugar epimerase
MRIFVTGGTGFVGTPVIKQLLDAGHEILVLAYEPQEVLEEKADIFSKVRAIPGNLGDVSEWREELERFNPDFAVHMAWEGIPDYRSKMSVKNLNYSLNFYLLLAEIGCKRVLTTGSCWEFGQTQGALSEDTLVFPNNAFTTAKNAVRMVGSEIAKENGMQFIWVRLYYVYGPGQKSMSLIPTIISSVKNGEIPQIKTPDSRNDFVFVDDVASAITMIIENCQEKNAVYNIGSGNSTSIRDVVNIIYDQCAVPIPEDLFANVAPNPVPVDFWADLTRITREIGWEPKFSMQAGIARMLQDF